MKITYNELKDYIDNNTSIDITYNKNNNQYYKDIDVNTFNVETLKECAIALNKLELNNTNDILFFVVLFHLDKKIDIESYAKFVLENDFINTRKKD